MAEAPVFPPPLLAPAPEPTALRQRMRARAEDAPAQARQELAEGSWIAPWLWAEWGPDLEPSGLSESDLAGEAGRWAKELWLWVMGERQWPEVAALLYGGTLRRAARTGVSPSRPAPPPAGIG
jgi:hypothetical protein